MSDIVPYKVLIVSSGSVAALKVPILSQQLKEKGCDVSMYFIFPTQ
jgi:phosphopantothenoylcysteine synthetase/decarboxylase